jgi:hypothetical protein
MMGGLKITRSGEDLYGLASAAGVPDLPGGRIVP